MLECMFWIKEASYAHTQYSTAEGQKLSRPTLLLFPLHGDQARHGFIAEKLRHGSCLLGSCNYNTEYSEIKLFKAGKLSFSYP